LESKRVLIVDDHAINREILTRRFESWGCSAVAVTLGKEAIEILQRDSGFDLILSDYQMPGMDGHQLARCLKKLPKVRDIPIVLLTSVAPGLGMEDAPEGLFAAVATKPIIKQALFDVATGILAGPGMRGDKRLPEAKSAMRRQQRTSAEAKARLLVAEDDPMNRKYMSLLLRKAGFRYDVVENGQQAIEAMQRGNYDLVLMDCSMPVVDGYAATQAIREFTVGGKSPYIIGLTGHTGKCAEEKCLESGMDHYMPKPIEPERLCEEIAAALAGMAV
jgi:CheY-like chemotaxis protein